MNILCKLLMPIGLLIASVSHAAPGKRIAVLEFDNKAKVDSNDVAYLAEVFRQKALGLKASGYVVMTKENMMDLLPPGKSIEQCVGQCEVETGRLLGASYVVTGALFSVGSELQLIVKVYDTAKGEMLNSQEFSGRDIGKIRESINRSDAPDMYKSLRNKTGVRLSSDSALGKDGPDSWALPADTDGAVVEFRSSPEGAMVEVDGIPLCNTPCSKELALGNHDLSVKLLRYLPGVREITVKKNNPPVEMTLSPNFGTVTVNSTKIGLDVFADEKLVGKTLPDGLQITLDTGRHKVVVRGEGYHEKGLEFSLSPAEKKVITLEPVQKIGGIKVTAKDRAGNDIKAQVKIDGQIIGETPLTAQTGAGERVLTLTSGDLVFEERVVVKEKEVTKVVGEMGSGSDSSDSPVSSDLQGLKDCDSLDDLKVHFERKDHRVCVHTVSDASRNLVSHASIEKENRLKNGLKIAFLMDRMPWAEAVSACRKIGGGNWYAPVSRDPNARPRVRDSGKSLEAIGKYLGGAGKYWVWSASSYSPNTYNAWVGHLAYGNTYTSSRSDNNAVVCVQDVIVKEKEITKVDDDMRSASGSSGSPDVRGLKVCDTLVDLRLHLERKDHSFCVHTVSDASRNLVSRASIAKKDRLKKGLKIAFSMDKMPWGEAVSACKKIGNGNWFSPESRDQGWPRARDESKSKEAIREYLKGAGDYFFWSASSSHPIDMANDPFAILSYNTDGGYAVVCVQ
jgi:hypothetical protein